MVYYVVGGIYIDTSWEEIEVLEVFGPYSTYEESLDVWSSEMWRNVDNCLHRLTIVDVA